MTFGHHDQGKISAGQKGFGEVVRAVYQAPACPWAPGWGCIHRYKDSEESHKSLAQETVAGLPGVKSVDNKLDVKGERPAENSDAWLTAKVKTMLLFHKNVSAMTEVDTKV